MRSILRSDMKITRDSQNADQMFSKVILVVTSIEVSFETLQFCAISIGYFQFH